MARRGKRWYDKHPELANLLDVLRTCEAPVKNAICSAMKDCICLEDPSLIDRTVMEYPLSIRRRWYDKDPIVWMTINALKFANDDLLEKAVAILREQLQKYEKTAA